MSKPFGITNEPTKQQGRRVDFDTKQFLALIEFKGARLAWSRATSCPCGPVNNQTKQPDPTCGLCQGRGFIWFGPKDYSPPASVGDLDGIQMASIARDGAAVIRGLVIGIDRNDDAYGRPGPWVFGMTRISVRPENKLGYYDRLVNLDSVMTYTQILTVGEEDVMKTRYPATCVNLLRSVDTVYDEGLDFDVTATGSIQWLPGKRPDPASRLSVHYLHHPVWIVWEHPNLFRETSVKLREPNPKTPMGTPVQMPIRAMVKLEFLELPAPAPGGT